MVEHERPGRTDRVDEADNPASPDTAIERRPRHRAIFLIGLLACLLAPAAYILQFRLRHLGTPWYLPIVSTLGVALMLLSLWRRRGILRALVLIPFLLLTGLEWTFVAVATRTPAYSGPAQPGRKVPPFTAMLADATPFTQADLERGGSTVLVFYRGRW